MSKYLSGLLLLICIGLIIHLGSGPKTTPTETKTIADALTACYVVRPPVVNKDPHTGDLSGLLIDIATIMTDKAQLDLSYVESTRQSFPADIASDKCDIGIGGFYPLIQRAKRVAFSQPLYYAANNVMVPADAPWTALEQLNNKSTTLAVIQGEFGHLYAQQQLPDATLLVLDASADMTAPLLAVAAGQADAGLITEDVIQAFVTEQPAYRLLSEQPYATTPIALPVRYGDDALLHFVNNAITVLQADGTLAHLAAKHGAQWYIQEAQYVPIKPVRR